MANLVQMGILEKLDAFLLVDKPQGLSFSTVVKTVKRKFNLVKVGHGGSLDTLASGLMILLINDANKFADSVMSADRSYEGVMKLGESTNTHDINGEVLLKREVPEDFFERAKSAISEFKGDIFQTEPRFCAVKRDDSPLYEVVDTGEHQSLLGHVYRFSLLEQDFSQEDKRVGFSVVTSKNVLPRTLINDFGEAVGCGATLSALRRTLIGKFSVDEAVKFEKLLEIETRDFVSCTMPLSIALR